MITNSNKNMSEKSSRNRKITVPQWQIDRMKTIINDRWEEVWQEVQARQR